MSIDDELRKDQLEMLAGVFRAEAMDHVKGLAECFFALEEGAGDERESLNRAFREAHSLKGSAGTLGFERVALVTHRLEDLLGILRRGEHPAAPGIIDQALETLDVIRLAVEGTMPGDSDPSAAERETVGALDALLGRLRREREPDGPAPESSSEPAGPAADEGSADGAAAPAGGSDERGATRQEFIRVAEDRLDEVITAVGELFEAGLLLQSFNHELREIADDSSRTADFLGELQERLERFDAVEEAIELGERVRGLHIRLRGIAKRFDQQQSGLDKLLHRTQEDLRKIRLAPVSSAYVSIRAQVREISRATGKRVALRLAGGEYAVDRKVLEAVEDPLSHLLRNSVDHGIETPEERRLAGKSETGVLAITARHTGDAVEISIADDGRGIDPEVVRRSLVDKGLAAEERAAELSGEQLFDCLFEAGFSTQSEVSRISGRGVGLDVVKNTVEGLGGEVRLDSSPGKGTTIVMRLPLAMSTIRCLLITVAGRPMAIPATNVEQVLTLKPEQIERVGGGDVIEHRGRHVPLGSLGEILGLRDPDEATAASRRDLATLVRFGERFFAFLVDEVLEYGQLILKPLGDLLERVPCISGVSLLGTGQLALVLNPGDLIRMAGGVTHRKSRESFRQPDEAAGPPIILVADDSIATRTLMQTMLESAGYKVLTAEDGFEALDLLSRRHVDLVVTDVQMPDMDGLDLTRTIKARAALRHLPVVLVTSFGSNSDKAAGVDAGADAYIVKRDLSRSEILGTIKQLL